MAFDEQVAAKVRRIVKGSRGLSEKKMFGGLAFMIRGHMCCGVVGKKLMVRVGPDLYEHALSKPHAQLMDFTGKPLRGFVYVRPAGFSSEKDLKAWIAMATTFARSLKPKTRSPHPARGKK